MVQKIVLVIGYGSIGKRHVANLHNLGIKPYVLTLFPDANENCIFIKNLKILKTFDYCIIATPTAQHAMDFQKCTEECNCVRFLIEKPLDSTHTNAKKIQDIARRKKLEIFVAYNMRFLKVFDLIREFLSKIMGDIRIVKIYVGQYLPDWHPGKNYQDSYSANRIKGGGADLDLSHEIDYMLWLFNQPNENLFHWNGNLSQLKINAPDYFKGIYKYTNFIVDVELDYIRNKNRGLEILGENQDLLKINFIEKTIQIQGKIIVDDNYFNINESYVEELREFLQLSQTKKLCTLDQAMDVLKQLKV